MGELVSFSDDIEQVGKDFTRAAGQIDEVLAQLAQVRTHVRDAFHNHPDQVDAAVAPIGQLRNPIERVQQLANALGSMLVEVAENYRNTDTAVAGGWHEAGLAVPRAGSP